MSGDGVGCLYILVTGVYLAHLYQLVVGACPPLPLVPNPVLDHVEDQIEKHGVEAETNDNVEGHEPQDAGAGVVGHSQVAVDGDELIVDSDGGEEAERVEETVDKFPHARLQVADEDAAKEDISTDDKNGKYKGSYQLGLLRALLEILRLVLVVVVFMDIVDVQIIRLVEVPLLQLLLELIPLSFHSHPPLLLLHKDLVIAAIATLGAEAATHGMYEAVLGKLGQHQTDVGDVDKEDGETDDGVNDGDEFGGLGFVLVRVGVAWKQIEREGVQQVNNRNRKH